MSLTLIQRYAPTSVTTLPIAAVAVSSLTQSSGTATCTTSAAHGLNTGDQAVIAGASPSGYNGQFTITVTSSTQFTYSYSGSLSSPATGTISAQEMTYANFGITVTGGAGYGKYVYVPWGPKVSGDSTAGGIGWSADLQPMVTNGANCITFHQVTISGTGAASGGTIRCFYFIKTVYNNTNNCNLGSLILSNGNIWGGVAISNSTGNFIYTLAGGSSADSGVAVPLNQWFELAHTWSQVSGNTYNYTVNCRLISTNAWTSIYSGQNTFSGALYGFRGGLPNYSGSTGYIHCRYAFMGLYSISSYPSDATAAEPGIVDPPTTGPTFLWDPIGGSDANDGVTAAWKSQAWIQSFDSYGGFPGPAVGTNTWLNNGAAADLTQSANTLGYEYLRGQISSTGLYTTLMVSANAQQEMPQTAAMTWTTNSIHILSSQGTKGQAIFNFLQTQSPGGWSLVSGKTYTYSCGNSTLYSVLLQDRCPLLQAQGSTYSACAAYLESTPGSYWHDDTNNLFYVHPLNSTNPASDGHRYESTIAATTLWYITGSNVLVQGIKLVGNSAVTANSGTTPVPAASHGIDSSAPAGTMIIFDAVETELTGNHGLSNIPGAGQMASNTRFICVNSKSTRNGNGASPLTDYISGNMPVSSLTQSGGVATVTVASTTLISAYHTAYPSGAIIISGASPSGYNGYFIPTVISSTQFTYSCSASLSTPATGTITVSNFNYGNESFYYNFSTGAGAGQQIGSPYPYPSYGINFWINHGDTYGFNNIYFVNCDFSGSGAFSCQSLANVSFTGTAPDKMVIGRVGGNCLGGGISSTTYNGAHLCLFAANNGATYQGTANNCILTVEDSTIASSSFGNTSLTLNNCTFDMRLCTNQSVLWGGSRLGPTTFEANNTLFLTPGTGHQLFAGMTTADTFSTSHCEFEGSSSQTIIGYNGANYTVSGMQTAGLDTGSTAVTTPTVDAYTLQRSAQSSITESVVAIADYTGATWANRQTVGAYEYAAGDIGYSVDPGAANVAAGTSYTINGQAETGTRLVYRRQAN